jgi:hypothetical protein
MKVTKEQKIYLGLLGLGLVAFAMDRFVFTPPAAQAADTSSDLLVNKSATPGLHATGAAGAKPAAASTLNPVAQKLGTLSESMHLSNVPVRDALTPSPNWSGITTAAADEASFEQKHELSGVMVSGKHPAAVVDGKLILVGQTVDGLKLISVAKGAAMFQAGESTVTLHAR